MAAWRRDAAITLQYKVLQCQAAFAAHVGDDIVAATPCPPLPTTVDCVD
jgi:hypothetical protein